MNYYQVYDTYKESNPNEHPACSYKWTKLIHVNPRWVCSKQSRNLVSGKSYALTYVMNPCPQSTTYFSVQYVLYLKTWTWFICLGMLCWLQWVPWSNNNNNNTNNNNASHFPARWTLCVTWWPGTTSGRRSTWLWRPWWPTCPSPELWRATAWSSLPPTHPSSPRLPLLPTRRTGSP